jgi:hypothetical protein
VTLAEKSLQLRVRCTTAADVQTAEVTESTGETITDPHSAFSVSRRLFSVGRRSRYFAAAPLNFWFSWQTNSMSSVSTSSRWFTRTVHGLV